MLLARRTLLIAAATLPFAPALALPTREAVQAAERRIAELERKVHGRLGVYVRDTGSDVTLARRAQERFAMCSTFKFLAAAAVLRKVDDGALKLDQEIAYGQKDLLSYAPETTKHVGDGRMRLGDLCAAAIQWSDNTAANLMLKEIGGPAGLTRYARSIGDKVTRLDRTEPSLNSAIPRDPRDTTSPAAIAHTLETLLTKDVLSPASTRQLDDWMVGDKVAGARLRAGLPKDWVIGDKTGTGDNGTANCVAFIRPPNRKPLFAAVYLTGARGSPAELNAVHADIGRLIGEVFAA